MIKVMIVDDEPFIRQGLKILINWEQFGFEICAEASNGVEAVELMKESHYDLIITDIKMPLMDGLELIKYTRENISKDIRFILLSGFCEFEYAQRAIKYNVGDYILKPVQREELIQCLQEGKEILLQKQEKQQLQELSEKMVFDRHLTLLIMGQQNPERIDYINRYLYDSNNVRYISIEYDVVSDNYSDLSDDGKAQAGNLLYDTLKNYMDNNWYHVYSEAIGIQKVNAVGLIYVQKFADVSGISEKEYILKLYDAISCSLPYKIHFYIGQRVNDITMISESYKSTAIAKISQQLLNKQDITFYDTINTNNYNKNPINKEMMDDLIRSIEENDGVGINNKVEVIYRHFQALVTEPGIIKINIDYLLFNLISLAKELDPEFEKEEIYKMISQGEYDQIAIGGNAKQFKEFALEFSNYLSQIRQLNFGGVLVEIEKEITENYMDNLSLKSLSEKYYINSAYLGQIFKKQYGIPFKDYLNNYRIDKAAERLGRSDEKIYLIANSVGFNNTDYFISKFVQVKGTTPLQYRKQLINKK